LDIPRVYLFQNDYYLFLFIILLIISVFDALMGYLCNCLAFRKNCLYYPIASLQGTFDLLYNELCAPDIETGTNNIRVLFEGKSEKIHYYERV
jgi:hypothetical protein